MKEGSEVLEKLAATGLVDEFFEAVDSDDVAKARRLMKRAGLDPETIESVLEEIEDAGS